MGFVSYMKTNNYLIDINKILNILVNLDYHKYLYEEI